ncbi:MAG TPA: hypothetical protein VN903_27535 [Polyangia bacterium]|jgi:hypothetical protein|nr:hypothetical protein [Polyangia bacterium]
MAADPRRLRSLNDALFSVYCYGRGRQPSQQTSSGEHPPPITILSLEEAVDNLVADPYEPEALRPMRLAILDLCRTRSAKPDGLVDRMIIRLARTIATATKIDPDHLAGQFTAIFQVHTTAKGDRDEAYVRALNLLADQTYVRAMNLLAKSVPGDSEIVQLVSWKEG